VSVGPARIRVYGAPCLRLRAHEVEPGSAAAAGVLDELWAALGRDGVGLAAPQIGRDVRAIVVRPPDRARGRRRLELVNPVLVETYGPTAPFEEGCLSFPGLYTTVWRPRGAEVAYRTRDGAPARIRDDGLVARILLHELDHLEGILFVDRLPFWRRLALTPQLLWMRMLARRAGRGE
jgi:peptide deformylase